MKTRFACLVALLPMAAPALAHPGAHTHPHGSEPWIVLLALALLAGTAVVAWRRT